MAEKVKEIACPECLRKRLRIFRVDGAGARTYLVTDPLQKKAFELEPWQFFVLETLPEYDSFSRLSLMVENRYGAPVAREDVDRLLALIRRKSLLSLSAQSIPLVAEFERRSDAVIVGTNENEPRVIGEEALPSSVRLNLGIEEQATVKGWTLFDPTRVLAAAHRMLLPLRRAVFLLPLLLVPAVMIAFRYNHEFTEDVIHWFGRISFLSHVILGLLTVNLLATFSSALVAYHYGVATSALAMVFYFAVWPRFKARVGSVDHLPRASRGWYYAAPLLVRLTLFSVCMLVWYNTRLAEGFPARFSLAVAVIAQISFLLTAIPLMDSNGYRLLATFLDAPKLRQQATVALANRLRGRTGLADGSRWLVVYALASGFFVAAVIAAFFFLFGQFLGTRLGGGGSALVLALVGTLLLFRIARAVQKLNRANARAVRFANWRKRETQETD